ncbi:DUF4012 domain-containing protein [Microbacterium sp. J1-1]|uniref:DUF4012 domain-containing protein n=1 Tax=Microbacterium sp. J1-1 TaxID=2992441 RepID=UPI002114374A|nr:DUF4012 domain-containing protein [Microbacterium sp. J1-1]UUE21481.1 DUF4012 domain-containing protein [Microbacterium sp. J1-1]
MSSHQPPASRKAARESRATETTPESPQPDSTPRRRRRRWIWLTLVVVVLATIGGAAWVALQVYTQAQSARSSLSTAMTAAQEAKSSLLAMDVEAASVSADSALESTGAAVDETGGMAWSIAEAIPFGVGENVRAVRIVSELTDRLVNSVAGSIQGLDLAALAPRQGRFNLDALDDLKSTTADLSATVDSVVTDLGAVDRDALIGPVRSGVESFADEASQLQSTMTPIADTLALLPRALGSDGPRNYLVMFQGNSEARSLGGNPAVMMLLRAEAGSISIVRYADTAEFPNGLDQPVTQLTDEEIAIYGDKIGRWTPDLTMVPDFPRATEILEAHWQNTIGEPYDAVVSLDPVALSYILAATGEVPLPTGEVLTAENTSPILLNGVYFNYKDGYSQNAFFAAATDAIFTALTGGSPSPVALINALSRAADEGRLLYWSSDEAESAAISGSRLAGSLPSSNDEQTAIGVYVNDNTGSKKSYYLDLAISASFEGCEAGQPHTAQGTAVLSSKIDEELAARLPYYVRGPYYAAEDVSTYVVIYGPVGASLSSIAIDGAPAKPISIGTHLDRPAVKIEVLNHLVSSHTIEFEFALPASTSVGPLEIWHTPMSRATQLTMEAPAACPTP